MQGYGLVTIEDPKYTPDGYLLTRGPGSYKIPSCSNIPVEFNVTLLKDSVNPKAVYSSKVMSKVETINHIVVLHFIYSSLFTISMVASKRSRKDNNLTKYNKSTISKQRDKRTTH